jgi:IstB-like ATP binding protein
MLAQCKRLVRPCLGFKSMSTARQIICGYEIFAMIRKGQVKRIPANVDRVIVRNSSLITASNELTAPLLQICNRTRLQTGAELLFEVFSQRYERGSTIVTSNLLFDERTSVFGSERLIWLWCTRPQAGSST